MRDTNPLYLERLQKCKRLKDEGIEPYPAGHPVKDRIIDIIQRFKDKDAEELATLEESFEIAGRIIRRSNFGRAAFIHILDSTEKLQAYMRQDIMGKSLYRIFSHIDIGDIVRVTGTLMKTKTGELTLLVKNGALVTKSLRPLPEKWHGLRDIEIRYRYRYLDLIANPSVKNLFMTRFKIIRMIREFFHDKGFIEVETPMMQPLPGGANARPFVTHHNTLDIDLYLRIAPELYLKRLLIGGFEKVFEINRNFRNEGVSNQHYPEFTMLEFYQAYANYTHIMPFLEELFYRLAMDLISSPVISFSGNRIDLTPPFRRITMKGALSEVLNLDEKLLNDQKILIRVLDERGIERGEVHSPGHLLHLLFEKVVGPLLIQPTFILDFPVEVSPLARLKDGDSQTVERFELFIGGREIANGFSELNDPIDQEARFISQMKEKEKGDEEAHPFDEDFLFSLEHGMPPSAGCGIGIDRLVMLYTDSRSIRDVILFPQLKPLRGVKEEVIKGEEKER